MSEIALQTNGLVKDYGSFRALNGITMQVQKGEIFGFLGPNGSGKSTTIRVLLNLLEPTAGTAEVLGESPSANPALRSRIGYLPGELNMAPMLTGREHLNYMARLRAGAGATRIEELSERFDLDLDKKFRGLSKGNRQKIGVVQAFMHNPELLILDEPSSGLDPLLQHEFLELVKEAQDRGATTFMSSHVLSEVEAVVGRVAIIREGEIIDVEEVKALRKEAGQHVELRFSEPIDPGHFVGISNLFEVKVADNVVRCVLRGSPDALLKAAANYTVTAWSANDRGLEELFIDFYRMPMGELEANHVR